MIWVYARKPKQVANAEIGCKNFIDKNRDKFGLEIKEYVSRGKVAEFQNI